MNYKFKDKDAYAYLKLITDNEQTELIKFLESKYFNNDLVLVALVKVLQKYQKLNDISKCDLILDLTKEAKERKIYKGKGEFYTRKTITNKFTYLSKLILKFLKIRTFEEDEILQNQLLIKQLILRGRKTDTLIQLKDKTKNLIEQNLRSLEHQPQDEFIYQNKFRFYLFDYVIGGQIAATHRIKKTSLQLVYDNIDYDYLLRKIKYAFVMINREQIVNIKYSFRDLNYVLSYLKNQDLSNHPILYLYYHLILLFANVYNYPFIIEDDLFKHKISSKSEIEQVFNQILEYLQLNKERIIENEQLQICTGLLNICVKLERLGNIEYTRKRRVIYKYTLKEKLILVERKISANHFCNLIKIGTTLEDKYWVSECMTYKNKVSKEISKDIEAYNNALVHFMNNQLEEAERELRKVDETIDFVYNLANRILKIKIEYQRIENQYFNRLAIDYEKIKALNKNLDSFVKYLKYDDKEKTLIHIERHNAHKTFIEVVKKLLNEIEENKSIRGSILEKINNSSPIVEKRWLLEKCKELE